jgi:hypothetical protein
MTRLLIILLLSILTCIACKKEDLTARDCKNIKMALINNDTELMRREINSLCEKIASAPAVGGMRTPAQFQDELVKKLNKCLFAESLCYLCIQTLPEQSEIRISADGVSRILDVSYNNPTQKLEFRNMHN